jgi:hypothetical protein
MSDSLPSIEQVAAQFAPAPAAPASDGTAAGATQDQSTGKGGTATDPNVTAPVATSAPQGATEEPVVGTPTPTPTEPKKDPLSVKFGALARRERELRTQQVEFNRKMADFEARAAAQAATPAPAAPKSALEALKQYGFKYSDATEEVIHGRKEPEVDPLDARFKPLQEKLGAVERLEQKLAQMEQAAAAKEQAVQYEAAMAQIDQELTSGDYQIARALGDQARDLVRDTIVEYYNVNQKMLDYSEACDIVEKWYDENVVAPILATEKVKSRLAPPAPKVTPTQSAPAKKPERTTLTNSLNSGGQATIDIDKMSKDDALSHLAKRLQYID